MPQNKKKTEELICIIEITEKSPAHNRNNQEILRTIKLTRDVVHMLEKTKKS